MEGQEREIKEDIESVEIERRKLQNKLAELEEEKKREREELGVKREE